jgi:carboxypeptidase Taq
MDTASYDLLRERLAEVSHLNSTLAVLQWDQEVHMPVKGSGPRAKTISYLSVLAHQKLLDLDKGKVLSRLHRANKTMSDPHASIIIQEAWRAYDRERKLPEPFVKELAELCSVAQTAWAHARKKDDFTVFLPHLKRIIELKRQEAEYLGYKDSPYDALLDVYEPGLTSRRVTGIFEELRNFLQSFVRDLAVSSKRQPKEDVLKGVFPITEQQAFNAWMTHKIGFDQEAGRLDISTHPFTTSFHPHDVRLTTRYDESNVLYAIGSSIHEMGHGLYEQGLPIEHFGTPLGETVSLGIHESQSRLWENNIGKSRPFWQYFYPKLQQCFPRPYKQVPFETFYQIINRVEPSFIRTESDEVTYNLHIILRFEIEKGLIEGKIKVKDLPEIWNAKIKEYLGLKVSNDRLGVLQDVHWSSGAIGYFPTYTLGNLYAAQFYHAAKDQIKNLDQQVKRGDFTAIKGWLKTNIHAHGKLYTAEALVKKITGEPLTTKYFIDYLKQKYQKEKQSM